MNTTSIGKTGEDVAVRYLVDNGYEILKRNYHGPRGEIDIIAKKARHISFVEVKTRYNHKFGNASDAVNYIKRQRLIITARAFLVSYKGKYETTSFDVCEVYTGERYINYIENAFE